MSDGKIPLAGIIGAPVGHSRSPRLHAHWLKKYAISGQYVPMEISQNNLAEALAMLPKLGFVGVNVTIPHKERVLALADLVTDRAAVIGAANTLKFQRNGKVHADNTDGYGFTQNLVQNARNWTPTEAPAAVFGAGGAARAVIAALIEAGVPEIRLANRTRARADALKSEFGAKIQVFEWVKAATIVEGALTVVNTTSLGMVGQGRFRVPLDGLSPKATVTDLVYTPLETEFLQTAAAAGCDTVDGLGMLLHQAVPGFERWFGTRPAVDEMSRRAALAD